MKTAGTTWAVWAAIVAASWPWTMPVEAATKAEQARAAAKLVEETLRREASEGVDDRAELLKPALQQAPNYEAAWWQSGFVYDSKRKEWLRWDEVQQLAAKDDRLAAYRQAHEKYPETIDGQIGLARWCSKHKLDDQARAHLTRVLEFDPNHAEARQRLGFRSVNGTWVDERDIAEARSLRAQGVGRGRKVGPASGEAPRPSGRRQRRPTGKGTGRTHGDSRPRRRRSHRRRLLPADKRDGPAGHRVVEEHPSAAGGRGAGLARHLFPLAAGRAGRGNGPAVPGKARLRPPAAGRGANADWLPDAGPRQLQCRRRLEQRRQPERPHGVSRGP